MTSLFQGIAQSPTDYEKVALDFLNAVDTGNTQLADASREKISSVLPPGEYSYNLIFITYDSLEYWNSKKYVVTRTLGTYSGTN